MQQIRDSRHKRIMEHSDSHEPIPVNFDAREKWPNCKSISQIFDQGNCATYWAVSSAMVMTDRYCIANNQKEEFYFSPQDIATCAGCQNNSEGSPDWCYQGCYVSEAIEYAMTSGVISNECKPYDLTGIQDKICHDHCLTSSYRVSYEQDKHKVEGYARYYKWNNKNLFNLTNIQIEIMKNGPVVALFDLIDDFRVNYTNGIYEAPKWSHKDKVNSIHAVRLVGWGTENGTDYWLAANSWGKNWGINGFFKIRRGTNELKFEEFFEAVDIYVKYKKKAESPTTNETTTNISNILDVRFATLPDVDINFLRIAADERYRLIEHLLMYADIPEFFDARKKWPACKSISEIENQGNCSVCWAVATAGILSDRYCIYYSEESYDYYDNDYKFEYSAQDIACFCEDCFDSLNGRKCDVVGRPMDAVEFVMAQEIQQSKLCNPYDPVKLNNGTCNQFCKNIVSGSNIHHKVEGIAIYANTVNEFNLKHVQTEIMKNGPVLGILYPSEIFLYNYTDGVYENPPGYIGQNKTAHAVKIIGWGMENGTPYWLAANSWGENWGKLRGFFKIKRGSNELRIEESFIAADVKVNKKKSRR